MKLFATLMILIILFAFGIGSAKADSDGYFCFSPAFLAYEFSFSKEPSDQHKLYIIHFGVEPRTEPRWLRIAAFQVHSMKCFSDRVEIIGWEKRYVYSVSPNAVTVVLEETLPTPGKLPEGFVSAEENLGGFSPVTRGAMPSAYTYVLTTNRPDGDYVIRLERIRTGNPCRPLVKANLVKVGQQKKTTIVQKLYAAPVSIECGE